MSTKKINKNTNSSSRKRCPKGTRRDKTGLCIKYIGFSVFNELNEREIGEKGRTISIEDVGNEGIIMKIYENGEIKEQDYINEKLLEKTKTNTNKSMEHIMRMVKKIEKNPDMILKDKKFLRFKKRQEKKIGGIKSPIVKAENVTKVIVQRDALKKLTESKIIKLQEKINDIEKEISTLSRLDSQYSNWWSQLAVFNLFEVVTLQISHGMTLAVQSSTYVQSPLLSGLQINSINFLSNIDLGGGLFLMMMDIVNTLFPSEGLAKVTIIAQYIYWTWLFTQAYIYLLPISSWWLLTLIVPTLGIFDTSLNDPTKSSKISRLEDELLKAKKELAEALR